MAGEAMEVMAMARGLLMPKLTIVATDMADMDTARGLLTLRLHPTMAGEDMVDTVMARGLPTPTTVATDMADTAMARGLLMPRLTTVATDMADTAMARGLLMPTMAVMDMADTDMARGPLMPTMAAMDMADTATASNCNVTFILNINWQKN